MSFDRNRLYSKLLEGYSVWYDVEAEDNRAVCSYWSRNEKYVLTRRAQLWATEDHDYAYIYNIDRLSLETYTALEQTVLKEGFEKVQPHSQHMCSYVTLVIVADTADDKALTLLKKAKFRKSYKLSFHGWSSFRVAAVVSNTNAVVNNRDGSEVAKTLRQQLAKAE